eukprot:TRINITY_DN1927_c0_g1_i1.p2 TRINITY_DN1927_c0_g1~~TRINITY_DN1927_c0_g1_i1.p2  ORF type:complete len:135 (+),score=77.46 TRINITY_DN1927_c0_g1_i1:64-468(+)
MCIRDRYQRRVHGIHKMQKDILLDDTIKVVALNKEGKFFESVTRIDAESQRYDIKLQIDINTDIYPVEQNGNYSFCIARTLNLDGTEGKDNFSAEPSGPTLADRYDYVMYGKICLLYTSPSPRDLSTSRMPSSA